MVAPLLDTAPGHGIGHITRFDATRIGCRIAGEVKGFSIGDYMPEKEARHMDRFIHLGLAAAFQAVKDSGLPTGDALDPELAARIAQSPADKIYVTYGAGHLPGLFRNLKAIDPAWEIKSIKW